MRHQITCRRTAKIHLRVTESHINCLQLRAGDTEALSVLASTKYEHMT
jgi:hypothetical protein